MKNVMRQIGRATGFFAIYFGSQIAAMMVVSIICGLVAASRYNSDMVTSLEETALEGQRLYAQNMGIALILSAVLALVIFLIIFLARKVNPLEQVDLRKLSPKAVGLSVLGGLSAMLFFNFILDFIPFSEGMLEMLNDTINMFSDFPLWQAIVGNALLIPFLEEVVFRGLIFGRLRRAMPAIVAAIITSIVFGLMHGHPILMVWAFFFSMLLCYARVNTDSILPGIIIHVIVNSFAVICNYSGILETVGLPLLIVLTVVGFLGLVAYFIGFTILGKKENAKLRELTRYAEEETALYEKLAAKKAAEEESVVIL